MGMVAALSKILAKLCKLVTSKKCYTKIGVHSKSFQDTCNDARFRVLHSSQL